MIHELDIIKITQCETECAWAVEIFCLNCGKTTFCTVPHHEIVRSNFDPHRALKIYLDPHLRFHFSHECSGSLYNEFNNDTHDYS